MVSYRALRQFVIFGERVQLGTELTRAELLEKNTSPAFMTSHGFVEQIETNEAMHKDLFVVNETRNVNGEVYDQGQLIRRSAIPKETLFRLLDFGVISEITESEALGSLQCPAVDCFALFLTRALRRSHQKRTGHKRPYHRKDKAKPKS